MGQFFYNDRVVIIDEERQEIIKDVHEGLGESNQSKAMASTYDNVSSRFFWYSIRGDVMNFVKKCDVCQQGDLSLKTITELQNVPIETAVIMYAIYQK